MARHGAFELSVPVSAVDHLTGSAHAPVTVVEYGDFECPNCKQAQSALKLLLERFDGRARLAFRNFPLEDVHPHALAAAEAAECAGGQGQFWAMHDLLFANQALLALLFRRTVHDLVPDGVQHTEGERESEAEDPAEVPHRCAPAQ